MLLRVAEFGLVAVVVVAVGLDLHYQHDVAPDRAMVDAYFSLPMSQRKLVRDLVASLARTYENAG